MPRSKTSRKAIVPLPGVLPDDVLSKIVAMALAVTIPDNEARYRWTRKGWKLKYVCQVRLMCKAFAVGLEETMYKWAFLRYRLIYGRVTRNHATWRLYCIQHAAGATIERELLERGCKKVDLQYMIEAQNELTDCELEHHDDDQRRIATIRHLATQEKIHLHELVDSEWVQRWIHRRSQWDELARVGRPLEPIYDTDDELWHSYYDMNR